jgi:hypothetical protein
MTKVFVATPMYGGMCTGFYLQSMLALVSVAKEKIELNCSFMFNESLIQRARNGLAHQFLQTDCTHLMFIDADIRFNPHDVMSMLAADKDVICGLYPKKEINWQQVAISAANGVPWDQLKNHTGAMVVNLVGEQGQVVVPQNEPLEIVNGGTGFMLIKREVFEALRPFVAVYTNDVLDTAGTMKADEIYEYFPVMVEDGRLLSEDFAFCTIVRKQGYKIYAAPWVKLGHYGSYLFEGSLIPAP